MWHRVAVEAQTCFYGDTISRMLVHIETPPLEKREIMITHHDETGAVRARVAEQARINFQSLRETVAAGEQQFVADRLADYDERVSKIHPPADPARHFPHL